MKKIKLDEPLVEYSGDDPEFVREIAQLAKGFPMLLPDNKSTFWLTAEPRNLLVELMARLNSEAPYGYYFGPHPDDALCYGFWPTL